MATKKKATAKKTTATRAVKKTATKKTTAKRATTKKATAKKATAKKAATKKATAKKAATKKATAKRATAKVPSRPARAWASDALHLIAVFPVSPERLYDAWLDAEEHAAFTGGGASIEPEVGGRHTAWDGYIEGRNVELERPARIVQTWRTSEFPEGAGDSRLELLLTPDEGGTRLELRHSDIPRGQGARYESGWEEHYFAPMRRYFG